MTADAFRPSLLEVAGAPYRSAGRFAWHFARGKLGGDPAFTAADYPMSAGTPFASVLLAARPR